jgi:aryl-alcohol dehydrogenase-like predicted oxidoreductase
VALGYGLCVEIRSVGRSGLRVSRIALGTMTWGRDTDEHEAAELLDLFLSEGGTLVDTADVYADGESEKILGRLLVDTGRRDAVVLATKSVSRPHNERRFDASRTHLLNSLDGSLRRLGVDHVDLWQLHAWDPLTPIEETLSAVDHAVTSGKVRYVGISNYSGWQTAQVATWQGAVPGRAIPVASQVEYSLLQRGVEREVIPALRAHGMGLIAWSALGRGVLTGKYRSGIPADSRAGNPAFASFVQPYLTEGARRIADATATAAEGLGVSPTEVALAWVRNRPGVTSALVGARTAAQLRTALASEELEIPEQIEQALSEVSAPPMSYPEFGWNQRS